MPIPISVILIEDKFVFEKKKKIQIENSRFVKICDELVHSRLVA